MEKVIFINISSKDEGLRLDKWIMLNYSNLNNSIVQKLIRTGQIKVNSKKVAFNYLLENQDQVRIPLLFIQNFYIDNKPKKIIDINKYKQELQEILDSVIYKDDNILIINKPAGIAVQGGSKVGFNISLVVKYLRFDLENNPFIVHRIDKDTSGILILARNKDSANYMFNIFKNKEIKKTYNCLVFPCNYEIDGIERLISAPLLKTSEENNQRIIIDNQGKEAITKYRFLGCKGKIGLIEVIPITGRTHQIRVHMAKYLKHPIVGDFKYGFKAIKDDNINFRKLYLHARAVEFLSIDGTKIKVEAKIDKEFSATMEKLGLKSL